MAVTLSQAKLNVTDDLQASIIDEFAKSSFILNNIPFHDCVSPVGLGGTPTYSYTRVIEPPKAAFRAVNSDYTPSEAKTQRYSTDVKIFGGNYEIDRFIAGMGGIVDEVAFQSSQLVKAASTLFADTIINGDSATDPLVFDGLDVAVTGTETEFDPGAVIDLSTSALVTANATAFVDALDEWLGTMDGVDVIMCNAKTAAKFRAIARRMGMYQMSKNDFGQPVEYYGNIPFIDVGSKSGSNDPIIGINDGVTSLYAVRFGLDGFHAITMAGQMPVKTWLPKFDTADAVHKGGVEMTAGCVLKSTKAAGAFRNIKVQ